MTNMEYVKHLLEEAKYRHGENAFSTRMLRQQLESMQSWEKRSRRFTTSFTWGREGDHPRTTRRDSTRRICMGTWC
jgi:hypothetical protein